MMGKFTTEEKCISELRNQGFIFYTFNSDKQKVFYNKNTNQVAEVHVYSDNSASALIGSYE